MNNEPLISLIIPTYNRASLIVETLDSVLAQTYKNWECIVVDDGSEDNTEKIIKEYINTDLRFVFLFRSSAHSSGGNGARNMGVEQAKGDWVMFLDSDDLLLNSAIEVRVEHLKQFEEADMHLFHTALFYNTPGDCNRLWNILRKGENSHIELIERFIDQDMPWHTSGVLWKKSFIKKIGGWNENLLVWQDWEIHLRAVLNNPNLASWGGVPDNFYRQEVENSIAYSKDRLEYFLAVSKSIKSIESIILALENKKINERLRYLILRFFIVRPFSLGNRAIPIQVLVKNFDFKILKRRVFLYYYFLELLGTNNFFRKITRKTLMETYYKEVRTRSTHLAVRNKYSF